MPPRHPSREHLSLTATATALVATGIGLLVSTVACTSDDDRARTQVSNDAGPPAVSARGPTERASAPRGDGEAAGAETVEFDDLDDLAEAIETGRFAERVGEDFTAEEVPTTPTTLVVTFVRGTDVPDEEAPAVEEFAQTLSERRDLVISLVGCSDPSGPAAVNQRISLARAQSVAARLSQLGVRADQIVKVEGRGEECAVPRRAVLVIPERAELGVIAVETQPESDRGEDRGQSGSGDAGSGPDTESGRG